MLRIMRPIGVVFLKSTVSARLVRTPQQYLNPPSNLAAAQMVSLMPLIARRRTVNYTSDAIFQRNIERELQHRNVGAICDECGQEGIVGDDLYSGCRLFVGLSLVIPQWFWIHQSCSPENC